jgi:hypothetical protein
MRDDFDISAQGRLWNLERELARLARQMEVHHQCMEVIAQTWPQRVTRSTDDHMALLARYVRDLRTLQAETTQARRALS